MIDLSVFTQLSGIDLGAFADKPTTLNPGQQEAATSLWTSPDGALDIGLWECTWEVGTQNALNAREARKSREAKEAALMKNILAFVGFATIFLILNALLFWDNREIFGRGWDARVAEEVGKAGGVWALAYVMTWSARRNRHKWIFGVSILILFLLIFLQPNLLIGKMNVG